ncbi:putative DNA-binding transcriptional regulator YafY [Paenibacillus sp. V4I9]|uniref:helix-turn-helix transcriptional regulator n=1 Tax=Paenibacillus sp. V4I9 TaxID=3042308 RepID=UPI0027875B1E|nr:transcriptional regulator [Paenibacillus sp. V4I9]MDQ0884995.1 putative DNA-binding transcriptional regulator YafY [Paenibacillus sp. V4I9]
MTERLIRLMRIINLIQSKPGILARELAERCETAERTIYRDLEALHAMNIPISNYGHGKGYAFISNFSMYPLDWTEQEALSFSMMPSVLEQIKPLLPEGFDSAFEKVMGVHQKEKSKRADIVQHVTDVIQMGTPAYREDGTSFLYDIIQASLSQQTIQTVYYTQSRNEESQRSIDPYYLVPRDHRFYLIGYCHSAGDIRTFRISRFRDVKLLNQSFDKGDFNLRSYMKNTWSIERGEEQIRFKVKFHADIARYVKEEELFVKPKMTPQKDGSLLFEVTVNHEREFMNWVSQYGPDAEILEPKSYRDVMRQKLERWKTLYEA